MTHVYNYYEIIPLCVLVRDNTRKVIFVSKMIMCISLLVFSIENNEESFVQEN